MQKLQKHTSRTRCRSYDIAEIQHTRVEQAGGFKHFPETCNPIVLFLLLSTIACSDVRSRDQGGQRLGLDAAVESEADPAAPGNCKAISWADSLAPRRDLLSDGRPLAHPFEQIAAAAGIEESRLQLLGESRIALKYLGGSFTKYKYLDTGTERHSSLALDDDGKAVDFRALIKADQDKKWELMGTIYPPLHRQLVGAAPDEEVTVLVKMRVPQPFEQFCLQVQTTKGAMVRSGNGTVAKMDAMARDWSIPSILA